MRLLLDTHLLLWAAAGGKRLPQTARVLLENQDNTLHFSIASLWEIAIKRGLGRHDFRVEPVWLHRGLLEAGYTAVPIEAAHALGVDRLPTIHEDPFDRMLLAQATFEAMILVTSDETLASYSSLVRLV